VAPQTVALTSSGQPSLLVTEQAGAEQQAAPRSPSTVPASPQPSVQPITTELLTRDVPDTRRMASTTAEASDPKLVDINTASVDELNSLGGRFGRAIVAGRPYTTIDELVSKRVLTRSTFSQIKDQITAN
jgi:DNA uptake protein ComE-like DNA-binding protein